MPKNRKKIQILRENLRELSQYVKLVESNQVLFPSNTLVNFVISRGGKSKMELAMQQLANGNITAATRSLKKVQSTVAEVAADDPLDIGDAVCLHRSEHGWHNGNVCGKILSFDGRGYTVKLNPEDGDYEVYVNHRRDMVRM